VRLRGHPRPEKIILLLLAVLAHVVLDGVAAGIYVVMT
jgi:hypothetical protein